MLRGKANANLFLCALCQQDSRMASEHVLGKKKKKDIISLFKSIGILMMGITLVPKQLQRQGFL